MSRNSLEVSRLPGQTKGTDGGGHGGTNPLKGVCPPASVPFVPGHCPDSMSPPMSRSVWAVAAANKAEAKKAGGLRSEMPGIAAIVDDLRAAFGAAVIDGAIAAGVKLQREHARIVATQGQAVADGWLRRQRTPKGAFVATEGGRTVGVMPS